MNLEQVSARVRPRKGWEAVDLGIALAQRDLLSLYKIWFSITFPLFLLLDLLLYDHPWWLLVIFWWLIPLFERPLLHWLSRVLFSEPMTVKDCVKAFFKLARIQPLASLTWRRFSFTRSTDLPIIQLEGLKSAQRRERLRVIHAMENGAAAWTTIIFLLTEIIIFLGALGLIVLMIPNTYQLSFSPFDILTGEASFWLTQLWLWLAWLSIGMVAPFYVAGGFAIYINQRTLLESWDIELTFRKLAEKLKKRGQQVTTRLAGVALLLLLSQFVVGFSPLLLAAENVSDQATDQERIQTPASMQALDKSSLPQLVITDQSGEHSGVYQTVIDASGQARLERMTADSITHQQAKALITRIKEDDEFHRVEMDYRYQLRNENQFKFRTERNRNSNVEFGSFGLFRFVAWLVEKLLWLLLFTFIVFLLIRILPQVKYLKQQVPAKRVKPRTLFGLDVREESLPDKPWLVAKDLIAQGKHREALSLLYRAALVWFIENSPVHIDEGDTELECLAKLKKTPHQKQINFIENLTISWRALAYAHQQLDVDQLKQFCDLWPFSELETRRDEGDAS